jgi:hypothetical protein
MSFILICTFGNTRVFLKVYKYVDFIYDVVQYNISFISPILLIGSVVVDAEFNRDNHGLIPATAISYGLKPLNVRTDS